MHVFVFKSNLVVESYTLFVLEDAFFLRISICAASKIIRIIHYTMVFASDPFGLYSTNADDKTFDDEVWLYAE